MRLLDVALLVLVAASCTRTVVVIETPSTTPSPSPITKTAESKGVGFHYPTAWHVLEGVPDEGHAGSRANFDLTVSPDDESFVRLEQYTVLDNITPERIDGVRGVLQKLLVSVARQLKGRVAEPLTRQDTAGHPGYRATLAFRSVKGNPAREILYIFFDGTNEYTLGCEWTAPTLADVQSACELARSTFEAPPPAT